MTLNTSDSSGYGTLGGVLWCLLPVICGDGLALGHPMYAWLEVNQAYTEVHNNMLRMHVIMKSMILVSGSLPCCSHCS